MDNEAYHGECEMERPQQVVSNPYRVWQSFKGNYFIGHTPLLVLGGCGNAWGGLINPADSCVNLFINTFTVSNTSEKPFRAQIWLNARAAGDIQRSPHVTPANTAYTPLPEPEAKLLYAEGVKDWPKKGTSIFTRIAEGHATVVGNYYGKIILPPGGSFIVYLIAPDSCPIKAEVAMGWWEDYALRI